MDAAVSKMAIDIRNALETLGPGSVIGAFPEFSELLHSLDEVRKKIETSREDRKNRDAIYASVENENIERVFDLFDKFSASQELMMAISDEKEAERTRAKEERDAAVRHRNISYFLAAASVLIALYSALS